MEFTLECSGNNGIGSDFFIGGIGNARWAGARLAPLLESADILDEGSEVVFWGADSGKETIRDNTGILNGGRPDRSSPITPAALDLTITEQFARSMSLEDALEPRQPAMLRDERRAAASGARFPVRLIAPGWYRRGQCQMADTVSR